MAIGRCGSTGLVIALARKPSLSGLRWCTFLYVASLQMCHVLHGCPGHEKAPAGLDGKPWCEVELVLWPSQPTPAPLSLSGCDYLWTQFSPRRPTLRALITVCKSGLICDLFFQSAKLLNASDANFARAQGTWKSTRRKGKGLPHSDLSGECCLAACHLIQ